MESTQLGRMLEADSRLDLWSRFVADNGIKNIAEIGVYRGAFAAHLLSSCESIGSYAMVDPWRHLDDWNKPANKDDSVFEKFYQEAMDRTAAFESKRSVLRGRTTEVIDQVPDGALDFVYIDGDHTLRGIAIDLLRVYPKVREGGWIGGDDFCRSIWQHREAFEPTLVFPFAVYFAEAVSARIWALPHNQFLIEKAPDARFEFTDLTGRYDELGLRSQVQRPAGTESASDPATASALSAKLRMLRAKLTR